MDTKTAEKQRLLEATLRKGMVMVHIDARRDGVVVPDHLKADMHVRLKISYHFSPPDLVVDDWGVRVTLTFNGIPAPVAVPWGALFAFASFATKEFHLFSEDTPPALLGQSSREMAALAHESVAALADEVEPPRRGHLQLLN